MPLDKLESERVLQLITSRFDQRVWRKKIEKLLSLPPSGISDAVQRKIFLYLKVGLQAYRSRRSDPPSWIVGGHTTRQVIDRARFNPSMIEPSLTKDDVAVLALDPGPEVDEAWWEDILVKWFVDPVEEEAEMEKMIAEKEEEEKHKEREEKTEIEDHKNAKPGASDLHQS